MPPAESILYKTMSEVHPGADSVRRCLAGFGNSRYLYKDVCCFIGIQIEWNRVFHRLYIIRGGVFVLFFLKEQ